MQVVTALRQKPSDPGRRPHLALKKQSAFPPSPQSVHLQNLGSFSLPSAKNPVSHLTLVTGWVEHSLLFSSIISHRELELCFQTGGSETVNSLPPNCSAELYLALSSLSQGKQDHHRYQGNFCHHHHPPSYCAYLSIYIKG